MEEPGIYARAAPTLDRAVQLGYASGKVISVSFPRTVPDDAEAEHPLLDRIDAYLDGERDAFEDVPVALTMATDRREVLEALRGVPYGEAVDVGLLARMTPGLDHDDDADRRVVRDALAENPAPLLVPDHRVEDAPGGAPGDVAERLRTLEGL